MKNTLPYTAGYIDGDGCFYIYKRMNPVKYRARIIISSTNKYILNFFKDLYGGHVISMPIKNINWKIQYHWYIDGKYALDFIYGINPFLIERLVESQVFISFINSKKQFKEEYIKKMENQRNFNKQITKEIFEDIKKTVYKGNMSETDFCYIAGFIDAECSLGVSKYKPKDRPNYVYRTALACNNTSPHIFYWFAEKLGGSFTFLPRNEKNPKHKNQICWNLTGPKLCELLPKIFPFLISKKIVCKKLMEFCDTTLKNGGDRQSDAFKDCYDDLLIKREILVNQIHKLNAKGINNV